MTRDEKWQPSALMQPLRAALLALLLRVGRRTALSVFSAGA